MKSKFCFIFAVLVLVSCKTTHLISKREQTVTNPVVQVIERVQKTQPQFKTVNVSKMSIELQLNERKVNVSATCKILKDSVLYLSIQPFMGIEMFRAEMTTDSIRIFDKMNRRYYVTDYSYFSNRFGVNVDFSSLQSLLTAQFFCFGRKEILTDSCKLVVLSDGQNKINFENNNMLQSTEISTLNLINQTLLKAKNSNYQLQTTYSDYTQLNGVNFPQKILLQAGNQKTIATCDFSIQKVEFNTNIKFQPTNPERFSRGDIEQLLKK